MLLNLSNLSFGPFGGGLACMPMLFLSIVILFSPTILSLIGNFIYNGNKVLGIFTNVYLYEKWFLK